MQQLLPVRTSSPLDIAFDSVLDLMAVVDGISFSTPLIMGNYGWYFTITNPENVDDTTYVNISRRVVDEIAKEQLTFGDIVDFPIYIAPVYQYVRNSDGMIIRDITGRPIRAIDSNGNFIPRRDTKGKKIVNHVVGMRASVSFALK